MSVENITAQDLRKKLKNNPDNSGLISFFETAITVFEIDSLILSTSNIKLFFSSISGITG